MSITQNSLKKISPEIRPLTMQEMIWQYIIVTSFASERKTLFERVSIIFGQMLLL